MFNFKYLIVPVISVASIILGHYWSKRANQWYNNIKKPIITPPSWVFAVTWPALYTLLSISDIISTDTLATVPRYSILFTVFLINTLGNFFWGYIFFILHSFAFALIDSVLVWFTAFMLCFMVWPYHHIASVLLIPYAAWTTFIVYLSYHFWVMNTPD